MSFSHSLSVESAALALSSPSCALIKFHMQVPLKPSFTLVLRLSLWAYLPTMKYASPRLLSAMSLFGSMASMA